jgi:hypothetical protein
MVRNVRWGNWQFLKLVDMYIIYMCTFVTIYICLIMIDISKHIAQNYCAKLNHVSLCPCILQWWGARIFNKYRLVYNTSFVQHLKNILSLRRKAQASRIAPTLEFYLFTWKLEERRCSFYNSRKVFPLFLYCDLFLFCKAIIIWENSFTISDV